MYGPFLAAWTKLRRPGLLVGTYAGTAAITALITSLVFVLADSPPTDGPASPDGPLGGVTTASLSTADGLLTGLTTSVGLFGIIAFCVAAAAFAGEYTTGTLRTLLVRQPRRLRLLGGTWAAVAAFSVGAVLVAAVVAAGLASALSGSQGIDTTSWFTADGLATSARTLGEVALAAVGYATLGSALGVLLRSPIPAVAIGIGWLFLLEGILSGLVDGADRWLPGQLLSAVANGGTASVTLVAALVTVGGYLLLAGSTAATSFVRRDVTA